MNKDKRSRKHNGNNNNNNSNNNNNWKNQKGSEKNSQAPKKNFRPPKSVSQEQIKADEEAIKAFKNANQPVCPICGKNISDISSALCDRTSGTPIHFDCALAELSKTEKLSQGEKIAYIGQGRFGIIYYENPHDVKHFTIRRIIEWENKESNTSWRDEMADLYSHVK